MYHPAMGWIAVAGEVIEDWSVSAIGGKADMTF
jgi:hypothetical protein